MPSAKGVPKGTTSTTLQPGESVSTEFHIFEIDGPEWPQGGYRIEFQFCLGEKSRLQSFYYMSNHHDSIRNDVQKELAKKMKEEKKQGTDQDIAEQNDFAISGELTINADEESFDGATAWVRVWEYDPRLADAAAQQFAESKVENIEHQNGTATDIPFSLGNAENINTDRKYYITVFIYRDGKVGKVENEMFFLDGFNKVQLPTEGFKAELKKLDR